MACGVCRVFARAVVLVGLGALVACSSGGFLAGREPWRKEAEARCVGSGAVREGAGVVRISAINGPGMCGADLPYRVTSLGQPGPLGFGDEMRPPGAIPGAPKAVQPRWPIVEPGEGMREPRADAPRQKVQVSPLPPPSGGPTPSYPNVPPFDQPMPLDPPGAAPDTPKLDIYDFRKPYGASSPPSAKSAPPRRPRARGKSLEPGSPAFDLSPEPYEHRRSFGDKPAPPAVPAARVQPPPEKARAQIRELAREPRLPAQPLGPSRAPRVAGATGTITFSPPATLACPMVSVLDQWIASAVQPAAMRWFSQPVVEIRQISAYSCRGMNGNPNARISEHAFGNALDIASFTLADGRRITVRDGWRGAPEEQGFLRDVQGAACERFTTVLAPGSNVHHYDHIHVDLMKRRNGYRTCNPRAVSGEEVAAKAQAHYARQGRDTNVTGSVGKRKSAKQLPPPAFTEDKVGHQLPLAIPGEDGED
jgi:hypothetical protein